MIEAYTNRQRNPAMLAFLFRRCLVGFEHITPRDVAMMFSWAPTVLETVVVKASGLVDDEATDPDEDDEDDEAEDVIDPEDSIWAKHNKSTHGQARDNAEELTEADLMYALHEHGETQQSIYQMLLDEIDTLLEGAERHNERLEERRQEESATESTATPSAGNGSRQDRAAQVFGR